MSDPPEYAIEIAILRRLLDTPLDVCEVKKNGWLAYWRTMAADQRLREPAVRREWNLPDDCE